MSLTPEDVKKISRLARLNVTETEMTTYQTQLSSILNFIEQLKSADTAHIEPLAHPLDIVQRLRKDTASEENCREKNQGLAPQVEAGLYLVPKVIEEA